MSINLRLKRKPQVDFMRGENRLSDLRHHGYM